MARTPFKILIPLDRIIKRTHAPLYPLESCCVLAQISVVAPPRPPAASMLVLLSQPRSAQSLVTKLSGPSRSGDAATTACHLGSLQTCAAGDRWYIGPNTMPYLLLKVNSLRPAYAFTCIRADQDRRESMPVPPDQVASSLQVPSGKKSTWRWILAGEYSMMLCCMV